MSKFQDSLRASVAAFALAVGAVGAPSPALAQTNISLPPASLENSLNALSRQTGVQILVDQTLLRGKKASAINGASSAETALTQLLQGSGLIYHKRADAFLIVRGSGAVSARGNSEAPKGVDGAPALSRDGQSETVSEIKEPGSEIIVTGSRIARSELESPMPVSVVRMEQANNLGLTTTYQALLREPALDVGIGEGNAQSQGWDAGISSVDLRGLGTNRTLTLLDGARRVSGSAQSSAVDLNMIPPAMIDRVEIITGGAAAIYGADAVTGAVNVITKKNFSGLQIDATNGISEHSDAQRFRISATLGGEFADGRGRFIIGGTYVNNKEVMAKDRSYTADSPSYYNNPAYTGPNSGQPQLLITPVYTWAAYSPYSNFMIDQNAYKVVDGQVVPITYALNTNTAGFPQGPGGNGGNLNITQQLQGPTDTFAVMGRFQYELTPSINYVATFDYGRSLYRGEAGYYRDDQRTSLWMNGKGGAIAYLDNPYLPDSVRQLMTANNLTSLPLRKWWTNFPTMRQNHDRNNYTIHQELNGNIADGRFKWQAFWQYGRTTDDVDTSNVPLISRWVAARDAIAGPDGQPVCRDSAARAAGCVPFDIFGMTTTAAQQAYVLTTRHESRATSQQLFGGNISGEAFSLPYGDLSFSLGAEHRRDSLHTVDDPRSTTDLIPSPHPNIDASLSVSEVYGEIVVPILRDLPFARDLRIEGAYRYSNYNSYSDTHTWKAGAIWSPIEGLSFRAVRSRSVRVPNFAELYSPQNRGITASINDPCSGPNYDLSPTRAANCAALGVPAGSLVWNYTDSVVTYSGGNPNLAPETSNSLTVGAIIQPKFLPGLDVTVDYWDINIADVITSYSVANMQKLCVDLPTTDNPFCSRITRDPVSHKVTQIDSYYINAARMQARGIDFGVNYRRNIGQGTVHASLKSTLNLKNMTETTPGIDTGNIYYAGDWTVPRFKSTMYFGYDVGDFGATFDTRFISSTVLSKNMPDYYYGDANHLPSKVYNNISFRYTIDKRYTLGLGINNLFDVRPTQTIFVWAGAGGRYDTIGRYFFGTLSLKL